MGLLLCLANMFKAMKASSIHLQLHYGYTQLVSQTCSLWTCKPFTHHFAFMDHLRIGVTQ